MSEPTVKHIQSGGRRINFYAELGRYFTADGQLKSDAFRALLRETLQRRLSESPDTEDANKAVGQWLSLHLEEVLGYLEERGLDRAALDLFDAALEESAALGVTTVTLSPDRLRRTLSNHRNVDESHDKKRKRDPNAKRRKIFNAALQVFADKGFHNTTMDEIAQVSQVAKGTLYRYFNSKEDLLEQLLRTTSRELAVRFSEAFGAEGDILKQIETFIRSWLIFIEENHVLYRLVQVEGLNAPSGRQTMVYEYLLDDFPLVKERFAALDRTHALKTPNFHTVAYGVLGFIDGVVRRWFRAGMSYSLQDELPIILEVLFNGFVRDASQSRRFYVPPEQQTENTDC